MKTLSGYVDNAYMTWLTSAVNCCGPLRDQSPTRGIEKPMTVLHESQPRLIPPPIFEAQERPSSRSQEWVDRTRSFASRASSRGSFSVRRKLNAYAGPRKDSKETRRTQSRLGAIGAPTDFRHVQDSMSRRRSFRPLELSIYMPDNQLSPILSHFGPMDDDPSFASTEPSYPPAALTHSRSESALSFSIPRKPIRSSSEGSSEFSAKLRRAASLNSEQLLAILEKDLPQAPPSARLREPPTYERVKSALHEKFELEQRLKDIEVIIEERQSIYTSSRPTSRMSASTRPFSIYQDTSEPMPTPPPALQPSFAARVATPPLNQRPKTAPSRTVHIPARSKSFTEASAAFVNPSPRFQKPYNPNETNYTLPPPPPLPLILQQPPHPPLRKKKSFSRVSNWLFPSEHTRNISLDSVTNTPKPVTSREGFYKCVVTSDIPSPPSSPPQTNRTNRFSETTASTLESEIDEPTVTTTWTPDSSPGRERGRKVDRRRFPDEFSSLQTMTTISTCELERQEQSIELTRARTFGEKEEVGDDERWRIGHGRGSVGVAF